jgi:hypothetical protein
VHGENALAYNDTELITAVKSFVARTVVKVRVTRLNEVTIFAFDDEKKRPRPQLENVEGEPNCIFQSFRDFEL